MFSCTVDLKKHEPRTWSDPHNIEQAARYLIFFLSFFLVLLKLLGKGFVEAYLDNSGSGTSTVINHHPVKRTTTVTNNQVSANGIRSKILSLDDRLCL